MRIDPDTSIHDLTDDEAADLRRLCEGILRGPTPMDHPLFVAWCKATGFDDRQALLAFTTAFLPRALHALLCRAFEDGRAALAREQAAALAAVGPIRPHPDILLEFDTSTLRRELANREAR